MAFLSQNVAGSTAGFPFGVGQLEFERDSGAVGHFGFYGDGILSVLAVEVVQVAVQPDDELVPKFGVELAEHVGALILGGSLSVHPVSFGVDRLGGLCSHKGILGFPFSVRVVAIPQIYNKIPNLSIGCDKYFYRQKENPDG